MATTSAAPSRLSFAKVAAAASNDAGAKIVSQSAITMPSQSLPTEPSRSQKPPLVVGGGPIHRALEIEVNAPSNLSQIAPDALTEGTGASLRSTKTGNSTEQTLVDAVKAMGVTSPMPSLVVNGSGSIESRRRPFSGNMFPDEMFQRVDSESEVGTKPPSLDGKSITSGTTFALDEKESLRPDDSASVQAAEDDDALSGRGSIVAGSRMGSEAAARAYRDFSTSERRLLQPMLERHTHGNMTPQSGSSGPNAGAKTNVTDQVHGPDGFDLFYRHQPDEKLLEALESPKDRIFLLKLEQDVIGFVKDSKEPFMDLPPSNSFCRMLTHKLADYYHMTHQVDAGAVVGAVRIFRTPFCRLPPPLIGISTPPTTGNTPPPSLPTMKIMRRGGDTGPSPSKATSETGSDGKDKSQAAKEKLSREEREAAYNKARERIFGKDEKSGDDIDAGNEMSRSSSVSTKDRTAQNKRSKPKQRRDDSDSFDVRSQYAPIYHQPQVPVPTWAPTNQYQMTQGSFTYPAQASYTSPPAQYVQSPHYNSVMMPNGSMPAYPPMMGSQYPVQNQAGYTSHSAPMTPYIATPGSPHLTQHQWQQPVTYSPPYQQHPQQSRQGPIPYAYGQLPNTGGNPADPKNQHPIPGSFNRHAFNPKTQSFVPGASIGMSNALSQQGSSHHGSPHHGSPHSNYSSYIAPQQFGNTMSYGMTRQGSNSSLPSYHASPRQSHRPLLGAGIASPHHLPQPHVNLQQSSQSNNLPGSHLPNYGNPSTLPPKPPTGV